MRILITGGGTGGHIYPALALVKRIKEEQPQTEFLYVGTERGLESKIVPEYGLPFSPLKVEGFKRELTFRGLLYNFQTIRLFLQSISKAKKIIRQFSPDIVIGTGGYVAAPVCYAASKENVPTIIHEQNSVAGITNKFLARHVSSIAICFEEARKQFKGYENKVILTGNPRAQEVAGMVQTDCLKQFGLEPSKDTVLIFGGSRGARKINDSVLENSKELLTKKYQILFVTGESHYEAIADRWASITGEVINQGNVKIVPYIKNMPEVFASVSLVVSRSGATTLAELTSLGVPSILIPSPNVTEDHQTKNAQSLEIAGAAVLINESELNDTYLMETLDELMMNKTKREQMSRESIRLGKQNASDLLIQLMMDLV